MANNVEDVSEKNYESENQIDIDCSSSNSNENRLEVTECHPKKILISFSDNAKIGWSLQEAFMSYQKKRQKDLKQVRKRRDVAGEARMRSEADPQEMSKLRMKFLNQAKKYFGTPYAKKYWTSQDPEYYSSRFLDCCGLVRQVLRDLKKDFGFRIGPWNQSYLCDTLPVTIEREEDMKPGDLVFISAIYHNQKTKKQKHNLTHVEIWLGDGPKTIGARWQRGKVQVFESYRFNATSYHSPVYIFKSIDTWLMGICRSHCQEHTWKWRSEVFSPGKKSIFYVDPEQNEDAGRQEDEGASEEEDEEGRTSSLEASKSQTKITEADEDKRSSQQSQERHDVDTDPCGSNDPCLNENVSSEVPGFQKPFDDRTEINSSAGTMIVSNDDLVLDQECFEYDHKPTDHQDRDTWHKSQYCSKPGCDHKFCIMQSYNHDSCYKQSCDHKESCCEQNDPELYSGQSDNDHQSCDLHDDCLCDFDDIRNEFEKLKLDRSKEICPPLNNHGITASLQQKLAHDHHDHDCSQFESIIT